jgi:photosystem II stability/assembly factor-like uncharacterized protein
MREKFKIFSFISVLSICFCSFCQDGKIPWKPIGLSGGGGMFTPAISPADPDLMMINCDMGGAYISENGGRDWQMINCNEHHSSTRCYPAFHPKDKNIVFAAQGGNLKISRDRGKTWKKVHSFKSGLEGKIVINPEKPSGMLVGLRNGTAMISRDAGKTWKLCKGVKGQQINFHFDRNDEGKTIFAGTSEGIWRSTDHGKTWQDITKGLPWKDILGFDAASNAKNKETMLYCSITSKKQNGTFAGAIYRSKDRGDTWEWAMGKGINKDTKMTGKWGAGDIAQYKHVLCSDVKPNTVIATNSSTGFHPPHTDTVYRSDDAGENWRLTFFEDPRFKEYNVDPNWVTASNGQCYKGGDAPFGIAICKSNPDRILQTRSNAQVTHNGGKSWFNAYTYPPKGVEPGPLSPWICNGLVITTTWNYYIDPFEPNRHYIAYTDLGWVRSLDKGKTWIHWTKKNWVPWRNTCYEIAFDPAIPGKMWGAFSNVHDIPNDNIISERHGHNRPGGVAFSNDFGKTWTPVKGLPAKPVTSIVIDPKSPKNSRTLYAGVFSGGVFKSTDDGKTWQLKKKGLGHPKNMRVYRVLLHKDGTLFAIICAKRPGQRKPLMKEGVGLYRSTDHGETWTKINKDNLFLYPKDFSVDPKDSKHILVGTCSSRQQPDAGGLFRTKDGGKIWKRIGKEARQTFGGYFHPRKKGWIYMTLTEGAPGPGLWLSKDDGATWLPFKKLPFSNIQRVVFDPENKNAIYLTTFGGSVWHGPADPDME